MHSIDEEKKLVKGVNPKLPESQTPQRWENSLSV